LARGPDLDNVAGAVAIQNRTETERVLEQRARYVARGVTVAPIVVDRAKGARVWDVDGRSYVDFAGGIGCQNTGHGLPAVVEAIHAQVDRYLHQCFMVGTYEPYVEVCRRLAELSPCPGDEQRTVLVNSGAEAVENAVKIARSATGRPAVVVFDYAFHGRTLMTMTMTQKVAYKRTFGPFAPEIYRAPVPVGGDSDAAIAGRPVLARAILTAFSTASAPELKRIDFWSVPRQGESSPSLRQTST
jgi:4-aminobutyrate aminotransferase-like enzyme